MSVRGVRLRILGRKIVTNVGAQEHTEFASQVLDIRT